MIGAMPAVAVRHERRRAEKRGGGRRPSQLALQLGRTGSPQTSPSPLHPQRAGSINSEFYVCGKFVQVAALHAVVGSLLLGVVVLVVGLAQLSPRAEAAHHRYYLMGAGAALVGIGILGAVLRCVCLHWYNRKLEEQYEDCETAAHPKNGVTVVDPNTGHTAHTTHSHSGHAHGPEKHKIVTEKPRLKSQASVDSPPKPTPPKGRAKELDTLIKQPSATSDT